MTVLTKAEADCLLAELDPYVDTEAEREALGRMAFTKFVTEIPGFGENFCTTGVTDINDVLQSDAAIETALQTIEEFVNLINISPDIEKLAEFLTEYAETKALKLMSKELYVTAEPVFVEFYRSLVNSAENQDAVERLMRHAFETVRNCLEGN
ncbi:unnamed protein product [Dicrocoelium dendriticum]|nr:unnamed protein product [Dicrocoelium dendriticum]